MKVGLFIGRLDPADGGGYTFTTEVLKAMVHLHGRCGHEFVLCYSGGRNASAMFPELPAIDIEKHKAEVLSRREQVFEKFPGIADRLYRRLFGIPEQPRWDDRIYLREGIQFLVNLVPWSGGSHSLPFSTVLWDLQHRTSPWFPEVGRFREWNYRENYFSSLLQRASIVYSGTNEGCREIATYYQVPPGRIKILPHPAPSFAVEAADEPADSAALRRLGVPNDYVFYPAQFWAHKNHVVILEACRRVRERTGWDLGVVFTGADKDNKPYVRDYARRLGLEQACVFLDFVERSDLIALYKGAFCLTYVTLFGPDNLPPLEAFSLGCPVIASAVPGAEEQFGDAALLFPPTDEHALAEHIVSLRDERLRNRMIAAGRSHTREGPTWDNYANAVVESLDEFSKVRRLWP